MTFDVKVARTAANVRDAVKYVSGYYLASAYRIDPRDICQRHSMSYHFSARRAFQDAESKRRSFISWKKGNCYDSLLFGFLATGNVWRQKLECYGTPKVITDPVRATRTVVKKSNFAQSSL
jgi:hypothetical protein